MPVCVISVTNDIYELYTICVCICYVCYMYVVCAMCFCVCVHVLQLHVMCACVFLWHVYVACIGIACVGCIYVCSMFFTDCTRIAVSSAKVNLATCVSQPLGGALGGQVLGRIDPVC